MEIFLLPLEDFVALVALNKRLEIRRSTPTIPSEISNEIASEVSWELLNPDT